jgi:hypothetical protein
MSETVYYKGVIREVITDDIEEYCRDIILKRKINVASYHESNTHALTDELYEEYFFHKSTGKLYEFVKLDQHDPYEVIMANEIGEGVYSFDLVYYNGGASMNECLEEALDKLN